MKIGIVTVFKSENCGSYLQAWALKSTLEKMNCSVFFLPYKEYKENISTICWQIIKCCLRLRFKTAYFLIKRKIKFKKAQRNFTLLNNKEKIDVFIFGSDTIWNFEDPFFYKNRMFFTGKSLVQPRIGYAVSCGSTPLEYFEDTEVIKEIECFDMISVRDGHTEEILKRLLPEKQFLRVVDPTLLLDSAEYNKITGKSSFCDDFMFVYYFGNVSDTLFEAIYNFARKYKLKLIKMGSPDKRFDINITNNPKDFIKLFYSAKYILTNTFHGCVFSVLYNKQFVTDGVYKKKVVDFINRYNLSSQFFTEANAYTIEEKLTKQINYVKINDELLSDKELSISFLNNIVDKWRTE